MAKLDNVLDHLQQINNNTSDTAQMLKDMISEEKKSEDARRKEKTEGDVEEKEKKRSATLEKILGSIGTGAGKVGDAAKSGLGAFLEPIFETLKLVAGVGALQWLMDPSNREKVMTALEGIGSVFGFIGEKFYNLFSGETLKKLKDGKILSALGDIGTVLGTIGLLIAPIATLKLTLKTVMASLNAAVSGAKAAVSAITGKPTRTSTTKPVSTVDDLDPRGKSQIPDKPTAPTRAKVTQAARGLTPEQMRAMHGEGYKVAPDGSVRRANGQMPKVEEAAQVIEKVSGSPVDAIDAGDPRGKMQIPDKPSVPSKVGATLKAAGEAAQTGTQAAAKVAAKTASKALGPAAVAVDAALSISDMGQVADDMRARGEEQSVAGNLVEGAASFVGGLGSIVDLAANVVNAGVDKIGQAVTSNDSFTVGRSDLGGAIKRGIQKGGYAAIEATGADAVKSETLNTAVIAAGKKVDQGLQNAIDAFDPSKAPANPYENMTPDDYMKMYGGAGGTNVVTNVTNNAPVTGVPVQTRTKQPVISYGGMFGMP